MKRRMEKKKPLSKGAAHAIANMYLVETILA